MFDDGRLIKVKRVRRFVRHAVIILTAWSLFAWVAAEGLIVKSDLARADALIVLAGSSTYRERAHRAAELFREGRAPVIVLTNDNARGGWSHEEQRNLFFVERAAEELRRRGVPSQNINIIPQAVSSTYDEALRVRDYAVANSLSSIMIVTSAYQSRRALWIFRRIFRGLRVEVGLDAAPPGEETPRPPFWWLYGLGWKLVPGEYAKLGYYMWQYR